MMPYNKFHRTFSIFWIILNYSQFLCCQTINDTNRLLKDKLVDYNKRTRPTLKQSLPTVVEFALDLSYLQDFNEVQQTLKIVAYVGLQWTDELMAWDPADYGGTNSILTDGFLPHGYLPSEMNITITRDKIGTSYFIESNAWEIVDSRVTPVYSTYYSLVKVDLLLRRKPRFVIINIIIPIIFLAFLNIFSFLIPPESGERISYSITVLLAVAVFLTIVSDNLPKTSNPMSYFSYFLMTLLATSVCIILCIIYNLRVYHRDETNEVKGFQASIAKRFRYKRVIKRNSKLSHNARTSEQSCQTDSISHEECFYNDVRESGKPGKNFDLSKRKTGKIEISDFMLSQEKFNVNEHATVDSLQRRPDLDKYFTWKDVSSAWDIIFVLFFFIVIIVTTTVFAVAIFTSESKMSPSRLSVLAQNE